MWKLPLSVNACLWPPYIITKWPVGQPVEEKIKKSKMAFTSCFRHMQEIAVNSPGASFWKSSAIRSQSGGCHPGWHWHSRLWLHTCRMWCHCVYAGPVNNRDARDVMREIFANCLIFCVWLLEVKYSETCGMEQCLLTRYTITIFAKCVQQDVVKMKSDSYHFCM